MYCSSECMKSAYERYHRFECEIVDELLTAGIEHISLRMLFEGLSLFGDDICAMAQSLKSSSANMTVFDLAQGTPNSECKDNDNDDEEAKKKKIYLTTISLASSDFESPFRLSNKNYDDYQRQILRVFQSSPALNTLWSTLNKSNEIFVSDLMSRLHRVALNYMHGIGGWSLKKAAEVNTADALMPSSYQHLIGNGCYLFASLLNHSCTPNVQRLNVERDKIAVIVSRPIRAGEQLFDSYRQHFNVQPKSVRRETLLRDYQFSCDCEACINDFPTNQELPTHREEVLELAWEIHEFLPRFTPSVAMEQLAKCYKIVNDQHRKGNFPSAELIVMQQVISNCLIAITKPAIQFP